MFKGFQDTIIIRDEVEKHIFDQNDVEKFGEWAFGKDYTIIDGSINFMKAWNQLHSDKLMLEDIGCITEDISKMVQIWKDSK